MATTYVTIRREFIDSNVRGDLYLVHDVTINRYLIYADFYYKKSNRTRFLYRHYKDETLSSVDCIYESLVKKYRNY